MESPIIIDIEASGFGAGSYPIEIGLALEDGTTFCCLIKPEGEWTRWDDETVKIHGIKREMLFSHGLEVCDIARQLNELLADKIVYSDGWGFDSTWLSLLYYHANQTCRFRLQALQCLLNQQQMDNWEQHRQEVEKQLNLMRHRASNDARILQQTYLLSKKNCIALSTKRA